MRRSLSRCGDILDKELASSTPLRPTPHFQPGAEIYGKTIPLRRVVGEVIGLGVEDSGRLAESFANNQSEDSQASKGTIECV